jgi:hypothetical protein
MKRVLSALCTLAVAAAFGAGPVWADDEPIQGMPGKILIVKGGKLAKFISKPVTGTTFALPNPALNDPTVEGATLQFQELGGDGAAISANLPALGWKALGNPPGSKGYKYKGAGTPSDPCKAVLVKEKIVKGICKGTAIDMDQPIDGVVAVSLIVGTDSKAYCTSFGGTEIKNDATLLKRKDSTTGGACTCGAGNPGTFTFQNTPPTAVNCGTTTTNAGATANLACNGLYIGSGSGSLTLPAINPDSNKALVMDVGCCTGETLVLNATTAAETGDIETCTSAGCFFGPPLPIPNAMSPATSTCVYNTYAADVSGTATCNTGDASLDMPLNSATFLTGDLLLRRCSGGTNPGGRCTTLGVDPACTGGGSCVADPDIQSCPICNPTTLICNGGLNNGQPCTPDGGQNIALPQFPTSHDCTVSTIVLVGTLPVPFALTTGTSTDTATDTGAGSVNRTFCGYCRDADTTGGFGICTGGTGNGMACSISSPDCGGGTCGNALPCESDADCATDPAAREACEQRNDGAFGPGGAAVQTITEIGTSPGSLDDFAAHQGTMVSVFCIPPSFNPIIDPNADLPGPGAVSLPGVFNVNSPSGAFVDGSSLF